MQRRLATYGEQGVAAASLASLEAACAQGSSENVITTKVTLDEKSSLRKRQRPSLSNSNTNVQENDASVSSNEAKSGNGIWNVRTFPFHRIRPGIEVPRRRLGIPSFGWPKPAATTQPSMTSDTTMVDSSDEDRIPMRSSTPPPDTYQLGLSTINEDPSRRIYRPSTLVVDSAGPSPIEIDVDADTANPRQGTLRCRSASPAPFLLRPIPKPITKMSRKKSPSPPPPQPLPPRFSSPLGPERHALPPRPQFPRSIQSRVLGNELRLKLGKDGLKIQSLGERGSAADMYRRILMKNTHLAARRREIARLEQLAAQAEKERTEGEVYVLRLADDVKGGLGVMIVAEQSQEKVSEKSEATGDQNVGSEDENMEVDAPDCGDIELLPDIPDMEFEDDRGRPLAI